MELGLLYSGGKDSTLAACLLDGLCDVTLCCGTVGVTDDYRHARAAGRELGFETARLTGTFELVVARDGRESRLEALSEGERELLGIIVAVAGYRTFDVAERVPVILLDGVSQLAADNLRELSDYLSGSSEILLTTAYPEAGEFGGHSIDPGLWDLVSDGEAATV